MTITFQARPHGTPLAIRCGAGRPDVEVQNPDWDNLDDPDVVEDLAHVRRLVRCLRQPYEVIAALRAAGVEVDP